MSCPQILPFNCCLASAHKVPWAYSYQLHWTVASSLYTYAVPLLFITTLLLPAYLLCHADSWLSNVSAFYDLVPKAGTSNDSYWFHKSLLYLLNNLLCSTALICLFFWTLPKTISSTRLGLCTISSMTRFSELEQFWSINICWMSEASKLMNH